MTLVLNHENLRNALSSFEEDGCMHTRILESKHIHRSSASLGNNNLLKSTLRKEEHHQAVHQLLNPFQNTSVNTTPHSASYNPPENILELDLQKRRGGKDICKSERLSQGKRSKV